MADGKRPAEFLVSLRLTFGVRRIILAKFSAVMDHRMKIDGYRYSLFSDF
jgi:hypothetical protein